MEWVSIIFRDITLSSDDNWACKANQLENNLINGVKYAHNKIKGVKKALKSQNGDFR